MKKILQPPDYYVDGILRADRVILSQAITLIESTLPKHQEIAFKIVEKCLPHSGNSFRLGITGVPGVGKSTFIEAFGQQLIAQNARVAVLAIDPTSRTHKGSILGDKTRMEGLSADVRAYIRPTAAGDSLGGIARKTRETMILCEAAGFDWIIVETVGVGQSETAIHDLTDFFLLLLLPNAGDELQGMKRGIVEVADWIAINKAEDALLTAAKIARVAYQNALHLFPPKDSLWTPQASLCSALTGNGIPEIIATIHRFQQEMTHSGFLQQNRRRQALYWLHQTIQEQLGQRFWQNEMVKNQLPAIEKAVQDGQMSATEAASKLLMLG